MFTSLPAARSAANDARSTGIESVTGTAKRTPSGFMSSRTETDFSVADCDGSTARFSMSYPVTSTTMSLVVAPAGMDTPAPVEDLTSAAAPAATGVGFTL
eukprot:1289835-Rhodomonas_salina.2